MNPQQMPRRISVSLLKQQKRYLSCTLPEIAKKPNPAYVKLKKEIEEAEAELSERLKFEEWAEDYFDARVNTLPTRFGMVILDPYTVLIGRDTEGEKKIIAISDAWEAYKEKGDAPKPDPAPTGLERAITILQVRIAETLRQLGYQPDTRAIYTPNPFLEQTVDALRLTVEVLREHGGPPFNTPEYAPDARYNPAPHV